MMKAHESNETRDACLKKCEAEFIRVTARKPVGGVENLRVCRECCPVDAPGNQRPAE